MAESTHRVEIVPVWLEKHPNADALSIVKVGDYQAIVRTEDWQQSHPEQHIEPCPYSYPAILAIFPAPACECPTPTILGAYIPPDSLVPVDRPQFEFLADPKRPDKKMVRVTARRLRGEWSMGLLIPAPPGFKIGDDAAVALGVEHYEPPEPAGLSTGGETESPPDLIAVKYDVEAFRKYGRTAFEPGEPVWVTEKIHGANGRWVHDGLKYHCGSRTEWKRYNEKNLWWKALMATPALSNFLFMNPGTVVYGEVYGQVQDLKYGTKPEEIKIVVFDILHQGRWVNAIDSQSFQPNPNGPPAWTLPWVPLIASCEFDADLMLWMADGESLIPGAKHCREGIVIKPHVERWNHECGRVNLKIVSNEYFSRGHK